ncbi:DUF2703 domain-containing protein [Ruminococcaceae bacterium OttesenSCG-928-O06]|nr:DUF2703 domain-containing protein [Ruminococcaceae bacterium OttesenSCG-928-O06]
MAEEKTMPCCGAEAADKNIRIDFLYLDLNSCERCGNTSAELDNAVSELHGVLDTLGFTLSVNKAQISTPELAEQYHFMSSPTIRVNGKDICADVQENACADCGDLCGSDVECRVFEYEGKEYDAPPKAMIMDSVLKAIYQTPTCDCVPYAMPDNLKTFFAGKQAGGCVAGGCCCEE